MSGVFVILSEDGKKVIMSFGSEQDSETYPGIIELPEDDSRYVTFQENSRKVENPWAN